MNSIARRRVQNGKRGRRLGLSLVEVTFATMITLGLMVVALETLGAATRASRYNANRAIGQLLAQDLMAEIVAAEYKEPVELPLEFGPEAAENGGTRAAFDDVDDFHGWSASPPEDADGTQHTQRTSWRRDVSVRYLRFDDLTKKSNDDKGIKEITVTVSHNDEQMFQLVTIRTDTGGDE